MAFITATFSLSLLSGKEPTCQVRDLSSIPGSGRAHGGGNGNPLQYSCLENSRDRGACGLPSPGKQSLHDCTTNTHTLSHTHWALRMPPNPCKWDLLCSPPRRSLLSPAFLSQLIAPPPSRHQSWPAGSNPLSLLSFSHPKQAFTHLLNPAP